jgi:hypothetical protein
MQAKVALVSDKVREAVSDYKNMEAKKPEVEKTLHLRHYQKGVSDFGDDQYGTPRETLKEDWEDSESLAPRLLSRERFCGLEE